MPEGHAEQVPPLLPVYPALHEQEVPPSAEIELLGQSVHAPLPASALYLPASQSSHAVLTPSVGLYLPASQLSHAVLMPASALYLPAPHSWHALDDGGENFPASQLLHSAEPVTVLYFPATQAVHVPSDPV